jgi:dTDP-4-amino-4,6-dideoxygalactose transaminase
MKWKIPFFQLELGKAEQKAVMEVLSSNWLTMGKQVQAFEKKFSRSLGGSIESVAVTNGTAALHLALISLGIRPGDEVILPALTFVACANTIRSIGAVPVFADICSVDEWNISPTDIKSKITEKTRAIMAVHYAGYPCQMDELQKIAERYSLKIIEDCSHAPLVKWNSGKLGTIGDVGCFSFFSNKNMTTGEGGLVVTKDDELAKKIKLLRSHGMTTSTSERYKGHTFEYDVVLSGFNYRMDEIRAAIGLEQLKKLPKINLIRKEKAIYYRKIIQNKLPQIRVPFYEFKYDSGYHIFPILLPEHVKNRNEVMHKLALNGIQTSIHYKPIHHFSAYSNYIIDVPVTSNIESRIISLPFYTNISKPDMNYVIDCLKSCL